MNNDDRLAQGTYYAKEKNLYVDSKGNSYWWLRSPYSDMDNRARFSYTVYDAGYISNNNVDGARIGVRPACWITL